MKAMNHFANAETTDSAWKSLYKVGGVGALFAGVLLLTAMISLIVAELQLGAINRWLSLFQNNWLVLIFKLHAGFSGVQADLLHVLNLLDLAILALVGTLYLGLYAIFHRTSKIWSFIALALPFLGIMLFTITRIAGRSSVMGAGLIISLVMLRNNIFNKVIAYMGILASLLLLAGDFSVGIPNSNIIAALFGIGYVLMMTWFFLVSSRLLQLGRAS